MARVKGQTNVSPEHIRQALEWWLELGTAAEVERTHGIPANSCYTWRTRFPDVWAELSAQHAREVRERHAGNVERAWAAAARVALQAERMIAAGEYAGGKELRALAQIVTDFATRGDHAKRLDAGEATSITETRQPDDDRMAELQRLCDSLGWTVAMDEDGGVITTTSTHGQRQ